MMTVIVCLIGAALGVMVAIVCARFALPIALRAQSQSSMIDRLPRPLNDRSAWEGLTRTVYRYVLPAVFAGAGAVAAYTIGIGPIGR